MKGKIGVVTILVMLVLLPMVVASISSSSREIGVFLVDEKGNPLPNRIVSILDSDGKLVNDTTTDENGYAKFYLGAGKHLILAVNDKGLPTGSQGIPPGTIDRAYMVTVPSGYAFGVYAREEYTSMYIDGATITVDGHTGTTKGRDGVLVAGLENKEYIVTAQHPSYNNGKPVPFLEPVNPTNVKREVIIDMEHTGEDALVRIYPRYEVADLIGAKVKLEGFAEKTTTQLGFVEYSNVPYGKYKVTVTATDFKQSKPNEEYPVDASHRIKGVCTIVVPMESTITPPKPTTTIPAFQIITAIATLLAVAYLLRREK